MFEYVKLKNFKSFGNVEFNILDKKGDPKKLILIYGENGAGKSNLASSFVMLSETLRTMDVRDILQKLLSESPEDIGNEDFTRFLKMRYKDIETLIKENKTVDSDAPMHIEFGFKLNNKSGKYILETDNNQIIYERLEYTLSRNRGAYFDISTNKININQKIFLNKEAYNEIKNSCKKYWGKHSLLSILLHESDDKASEYIKEQISDNFGIILKFFTRVSCKVKFGSRQERGIIGLPAEIFGNFDNGKIDAEDEYLLDNTEKMLNAFFQKTHRDIKSAYYKRTKKDSKIHYKLMLTKVIAGEIRNIEFSYESTGTQSLVQLLPYMLVVIDGSVSVIDEFDTGVHDLLVQTLVTSLNQHLNGQLILTTHNTLLMESGLPKECIYVINETVEGNKEIKCITHYDPKIHQNTNIRNQYIDGSYRAIPNKTLIDFTSLLDVLREH